MKKSFTKAALAAVMLASAPTAVQAQGFLKKASKSLGKAAETVTSVTQAGDTAQSGEQATVDNSKKELLMNNVPNFKVSKVTQTGADGKVLTNNDGTPKYYYFVTDSQGQIWDAESAEAVVSARSKVYKSLIAKVGTSTLTGVAGGLLGGGGAKGALKGAGVGALAGLGLSINDIVQIKTYNKNLKALRETLEIYKQTFTEEGLPKDASADMASIDKQLNVDSTPISKTAEGVKAEFSKSATTATEETKALEEFDI